MSNLMFSPPIYYLREIPPPSPSFRAELRKYRIKLVNSRLLLIFSLYIYKEGEGDHDKKYGIRQGTIWYKTRNYSITQGTMVRDITMIKGKELGYKTRNYK